MAVATINIRIREELCSPVLWGLELESSDERATLPLYARRITCEKTLAPALTQVYAGGEVTMALA